MFLRVSIWEGGLPNAQAARPAYASLDVDIPRSICHLSVRRIRPSVFAAKREPRLRSHSLSPALVFPRGVRQNREVFYKGWLRRSRPRLPSGAPLPTRAPIRAGPGVFQGPRCSRHSMPSHSSVHQPRWLRTWAFTCAPIHYHTFDLIYSPWIKDGLHCVCCRGLNTTMVVCTVCPLALYSRNKQTVLLCLFFL